MLLQVLQDLRLEKSASVRPQAAQQGAIRKISEQLSILYSVVIHVSTDTGDTGDPAEQDRCHRLHQPGTQALVDHQAQGHCFSEGFPT